jgi:hypothetical protein
LLEVTDVAGEIGYWGRVFVSARAYTKTLLLPFSEGVEPAVDRRLRDLLSAFRLADLLAKHGNEKFPFQVSLSLGAGKRKRIKLLANVRRDDFLKMFSHGELEEEPLATICLPDELTSRAGLF